MRQRLNLAKRPFVDTRPANLAAVALGLAVLVLSTISWRTFQRYQDGSRKSRESIASLRDEIDRLESRRRAGEAALTRFDFDEISRSATDAAAIARRRAFSWTRFLTRLERTLPSDVRVVSIGLERGKGDTAAKLRDDRFTVTLDLVARDPDALPKTIRALYESPWFDRPVPTREQAGEKASPDGKRLGVTVAYRDAEGLARPEGKK